MDGGLLFSIAGAGIPLVVFLTQALGRATAWRHAAHGSGLSNVHEKRPFGLLTELRGDADGFTVTLRAYRRGRYDHGTRIVVDGRRHIPLSLNLRAEGFGASLDRTFGGKELEIGDPGFDGEVYVRGPEDVLLPLLDDKARSAVRAVVALRGQVADGTVRVDIRTWTNANRIAAALDKALLAARHLRRPEDAVECLVKIAGTDHYPGVRVRCLDLLRRAHADDERARTAFRGALRSADTESRLIGAIASKDEGRQALIEIASSPDMEEALAVRAITALGANLALDRAASILDAAMKKERPTVARAAIQALALAGGALAVSRLASLLTADAADLAVAAAAALAAVGDASAEAPLVAALSSEHGELRIAAVGALQNLGTAAAVAPLHAAAADHLLDLSLRSAARQAVAAIQARLPGASPGQISLGEAETGQLTLAEPPEPGRLSIAQTRGSE